MIRRVRLLGLVIIGVLALPVAVAQANDTWRGASFSQQWSDAGNWTAGVPIVSPGILTFPDLAGCAAPASCYTTQDGLPGITAGGLVFGNASAASQYRISGQTLTVGSGGIADTPGHGTSVVITAPLALSAGQTWNVGAAGSYNSLNINGGVTGSSSALAVMFTPFGLGPLSLYVVKDMEVGPVTVTGPGALHIGGPPTTGHPGTVNASDHNPTTISGSSLVANPGSTTGPLNITSSALLLGTYTHNNVATTLAVSGAATMDANSTTTTFINNNGSTPGIDFSQLSASGDIRLAGRLNLGQGLLGVTNPGCASLSPGDVATLFTTSGTLTGTFANAPQDGLYTLAACGSGTAPQVLIHYSANSVTATVVGGATATTTTLGPPNPSPAATNQPVTLTATVTTSISGNVAPAGTVAFAAGGTPIPGCTAQPVAPTFGPSGTATCTTSFPAASSPESLTATFTGTPAFGQGSSVSTPAQSLTISKSSTTTALSASDSSPAPGAVVTYTAAVTAADPGANSPSGTVSFLDADAVIPGCGSLPLTVGAPASVTCTTAYSGAGSHSITATYEGDTNFGGSSSPATSVIVPVPASPAPAPSPAPTPTSPSTPPPPTRASASAPPPAIIAITSAATPVGTTEVTLRGLIRTGGVGVRWRFQYGRSAAYGQATRPQMIAAGRRGTVSVSVTVRRLSPHARYQYGLMVYPVSHGARVTSGRSLTFTTKATGRLTGPAPQLTVTGQTIAVAHTCQSAVRCVGGLTLTTRIPGVRRARRAATVVCATGGFRIAAHRTARARLTLTAACLSRFRAQPSRTLVVTDTAQPATGQLGLRRRITLMLGQSTPAPVIH